MAKPDFSEGEFYAHDHIISVLKVGNSGGMRVALAAPGQVQRLVLFSTVGQETSTQDNPYQDRRSEGGILHYTGTGRFGRQSLAGPNLRLTQQPELLFPIYVFSLVRHRKSAKSPSARWRFVGLHRYLDHRCEEQGDLLGLARSAWVFRLQKLDCPRAHPSLETEARALLVSAQNQPNPTAPASMGYSSAELQPLLTQLRELTPYGFERFIQGLLVSSNFRNVQITKQSADKGVDVLARMPESVWVAPDQLIQLQAKRWRNPVGRREVAELRGSLAPRALGVLITTGSYAQTAISEADRPNMLPISLLDGYRLASVVKRLGLPIVEPM